MNNIDKQSLIDFEEEIKELFLQKKIRAPIHLSRGNERQLIEIFQNVRDEDFICSTHRSHYHALLKGIPPDWLKQEILTGRSMHIMNAEHNFFSSSIVGGTLPIAIGVAMGIKMKGEKRHVWCFIGDMASFTGSFHEARTYAKNFNLPVTFVIEDNGLSTNTPTQLVWGFRDDNPLPQGEIYVVDKWKGGGVLRYFYIRQCEHVGTPQFVKF